MLTRNYLEGIINYEKHICVVIDTRKETQVEEIEKIQFPTFAILMVNEISCSYQFKGIKVR